MRTGKVLGFVIGAIVALIALSLIAVRLFVNPNDYKPRIEASVKNATGRELQLEGDIKLSVFPWVALELGPASLGNPAGFPDQPFVSFQHASVRVKLLPLLSKRLEVGRVELDGLDLKLLKNAQGKGNWEGFGGSKETAPAGATPNSGGGAALAGIEGVKITHASVSYENLTVDDLTLETGSFAAKSVVPVTLHVEAARGAVTVAATEGVPAHTAGGEHATLDLRFDFSADAAAGKYRVAALNLNSVVTRPGNDRPVRISVTAPAIDVDLHAQTLRAPTYEVNAAGALVNGSVNATSILDVLEATGSVKLAPLVVREWLPRLSIAIPKTRDPKALTTVSASGDFLFGKHSVHVSHLLATLDDTHLKGNLAVDLNTEAVNFDLGVDALDADRYLPPPPPAGTPVPVPVAPAAPPPKSAEAAKPLDANGTLSVGSIHFSPLDLTDVRVTVATQAKVMRIFPLKAQVYGGQYSGDVTMDNRTTTPAVSLDEHLTGIDVGKLMASGSKYMHVTGKGNVDLKATARGEGADAILKTLNGKFDLNVADGAVEGIDLGYALAQADALIGKHELSSAPNTKRTKFDALKMSADISAGIATTKDLIISSPVFKITGQGNANLPAKTVDLALLADTLKTAGNAPLKIPVKVTGSMTDPTVRPDVEALAKGALKDKAKDFLQDKLKGLFH